MLLFLRSLFSINFFVFLLKEKNENKLEMNEKINLRKRKELDIFFRRNLRKNLGYFCVFSQKKIIILLTTYSQFNFFREIISLKPK